MRDSPSIVPDALGQDVYLVLDNFGGAFGGLAWPETDVTHTDRTTLIRHLLVLLSQSVAAFAQKNHIFERTHLFSMRRG